MIIQTWAQITVDALKNLWLGFMTFIPKLVGAAVVLLLGWFIAVLVEKLVVEILNRVKLNQLSERTGLKKALEKAELKVNASTFIGAIVKWILIIVFLSASVEILGLVQFANFLNNVLTYLPNVVVAVLIFVVTVIMVDIVEKLTRTAVEGAKVGYGYVISKIVKWSIWIFASLAILQQLQIAGQLPQIFFTGLVGVLVLALGLSFGLGGKDVAAEILHNLKNKLKE